MFLEIPYTVRFRTSLLVIKIFKISNTDRKIKLRQKKDSNRRVEFLKMSETHSVPRRIVSVWLSRWTCLKLRINIIICLYGKLLISCYIAKFYVYLPTVCWACGFNFKLKWKWIFLCTGDMPSCIKTVRENSF